MLQTFLPLFLMTFGICLFIVLMQEFGCRVDIYDPWADPAAVRTEYGLTSFKDLKALASNYDAIVAAVAHREFSDMSLRKYTCADGVIFDLKGFVPRDIVDGRL